MITRHRDEFPIRLMCRVLEVSPAGYYASRHRPPSWHALIDEVLLARVRIMELTRFRGRLATWESSRRGLRTHRALVVDG